MYATNKNVYVALSIATIIGCGYTVMNRVSPTIVVSKKTPNPINRIRVSENHKKTFDTNSLFLVKNLVDANSGNTPIPRTELGRKLLEFRKKALENGMYLLSADEINLQINEARGQVV